jgi:DNA-binding protein H-NS
MATLSAIQKQIADLEKQASAIQKAEVGAATAKIKELMGKYHLTASDLGLPSAAGRKSAKVGAAKRKPVARKTAGIPKFRDPKTGQTWTGNGKAPGWIAGAKNRDKFLINAPAAVAPAAVTKPAPKKRAAKKSVAAVAKLDTAKAATPKAPAKAAKAAAPAAPTVKKTRAKKAVSAPTAVAKKPARAAKKAAAAPAAASTAAPVAATPA